VPSMSSGGAQEPDDRYERWVPGCAWSKMTSDRDWDPALKGGSGVEPPQYPVEKVDITGSNPKLSHRRRPVVRSFTKHPFPYLLEQSQLPSSRPKLSWSPEAGAYDLPDPLAWAGEPPQRFPSRFAKRVDQSQRGSSSKPWLLQNLHPEGDGGEEHCIWDSDGASRRVGDKTEVVLNGFDARLHRRRNYGAEIGLPGASTSINFGRPELMKSAMMGTKPMLAEMPKRTKTEKTELAVEEEEESEASPKRAPQDLGAMEGVVGRERWLPSFYEDMLKKSRSTGTIDDAPVSP